MAAVGAGPDVGADAMPEGDISPMPSLQGLLAALSSSCQFAVLLFTHPPPTLQLSCCHSAAAH